MSVESISRDDERHPSYDEPTPQTDLGSLPPRAAETIPPEEAYRELIHEPDRICPRCLRWRVPAERGAIGYVKQAGVHAKIVAASVVDEWEVYPPRVPLPKARREGDVAHADTRACPRARSACECGDVDGGQVGRTRSKQELLALVPAIARRLGEWGYLYDLDLLRAMVDRTKSDPRLQGDDDRCLTIAVAMSIRKGRGEDPAVVWDELED